ncbi:AhpC/TSA family protein [Nonlabens dokdonensis]|nr:TlpA disulfide reductase family protein [Nonlabens dokdonensis]PZX43128.1 AhpC/TSA family protein [Nonlabens dokdonensis]
MKKLLIFLTIIILITSCDNRPISKVEKMGQEGLRQTVQPSKEKIKVINFWATWCAPCVEELPHFEDLGSRYQDKIEVILISLDEAQKIDTAVQPFLEENKIKSTVLLLDDPYAAEWIPVVDEHWDGAIPVTLIVSKDKKQFYNKALTQEQLEDAINTFL